MQPTHRKKRRAINEPGQAHFLTFSCFRRLPLLNKDRSRMWLIDALKQVRTAQKIDLWAYVIMPEHVHLLLMPRSANYEMRRIVAAMKAPVSRQAKAHLEETSNHRWLDRLTVQRGDRRVFQFWQAGGGYDQNLWTARPIREVIDYVHANPVRRGLVERPTDWKWSSARTHAGLEEGVLKMDQVHLE